MTDEEKRFDRREEARLDDMYDAQSEPEEEEDEMKPTQEQVIAWAQCPCCGLQWDKDTEQHACIELFGECISCRFVPNSKGTRSGSHADIDAIQQKHRNMMAEAIRARREQ